MMVIDVKLRRVIFLFTFFLLFALVTNVANTEATQWSDKNTSFNSSVSVVIDREAFLNSIPPRMVVGRTYRVVVIVTNLGTELTNFLVDITYPYRNSRLYFYSPQVWKPMNLTLDSGDSQKIEFPITPLVEHVGELDIEARLFSRVYLQTLYSVSATVYEIEKALPIELLWGMFGFIVFIISFSLVIIFLKKPASRFDILISLLFFTLALLPRMLSAKNLSLHNDESIFWQGSLDFLLNDWEWSRHYMLIGYPPVFYYILSGIIYLIGFNLMGIRTISFISGSLTIVVLYFLAKSLFNRKVGLASALLLCFSSYHIYYSGIAVTDTLVILLMLLSAYFFWIGWQRDVLKYFVLSGLFFGLVLDVKYIIIVMLPAVILFMVWIRKSFRCLLEKGVLFWASSFLVTIAPVQLTLILNDINIWGLYLKQAFGSPSVPGQKFYPIQELIPRGFRMFIYSMARTASPWLPWLSIFEIAICISLIITVAYHIYATLNNQSRESFLLIFMAAMISLLLDPIKHNKWLLYSFPFFFTMLSNITDRYLHDIITRTSRLLGTNKFNLLKIFALLFGFIFVFSSIFVGIITPFIDEGEYAAIHSSILFIRNRANPYDFIAGFEVRTLYYYIDLYELDTVCISLKIIEVPQLHEESMLVRIQLNEQLLTTLKPRFIIENRAYFNYFYNVTAKQWVLQNYDLIFISRPPLGYRWAGTEFYESLVFERKS